METPITSEKFTRVGMSMNDIKIIAKIIAKAFLRHQSFSRFILVLWEMHPLTHTSDNFQMLSQRKFLCV